MKTNYKKKKLSTENRSKELTTKNLKLLLTFGQWQWNTNLNTSAAMIFDYAVQMKFIILVYHERFNPIPM